MAGTARRAAQRAARLSDPLGGAENSAPRAGIRGDFVLGRADGPAGEVAKGREVTTTADGKSGRAEAVGGLAADVLLDDPVFE